LAYLDKDIFLTFFNFLYSIIQIITQLLKMLNNKPKKSGKLYFAL